MTITIRQSGGFAGGQRTLVTADLDRLPPPTAGEVRRRVEDLSRLAASGKPSPGADRFEYHIEVGGSGSAPQAITVIDEGSEDPRMQLVLGILELLGQ